MHIYLLRHGIAEDTAPSGADRDRALTDEGRRRLAAAARAWRRLVAPPALVLVSPLRRARETASVFVDAVRHTGELREEAALVPEAPVAHAMALLEAEQHAATPSVALVGHEPLLGHLLGLLLTGQTHLPVPF
jgi:phosphohistidine phosphatase